MFLVWYDGYEVGVKFFWGGGDLEVCCEDFGVVWWEGVVVSVEELVIWLGGEDVVGGK